MKKVFIFGLLLGVVSFTGCISKGITSFPDRGYEGNGFTLALKAPKGYNFVEGTKFNMGQNGKVVDGQVFTTLSFVSKENGVGTIFVEEVKNEKKLNLDSFLNASFPNREMYSNDQGKFFEELKKNEFENIKTEHSQMWLEGLTENLSGYEAFAYVMDSNSMEHPMYVVWNLSTPEDSVNETISKDIAEKEYEAFKKMLKEIKIQ